MEEVAVEDFHLWTEPGTDHPPTSLHTSSTPRHLHQSGTDHLPTSLHTSSTPRHIHQPGTDHPLTSLHTSSNPRHLHQTGTDHPLTSPSRGSTPAGSACSSSDEDSVPSGSNCSAGEFDSQTDTESLVGFHLGQLASAEGSSLENLSDTGSGSSSGSGSGSGSGSTKPPPGGFWKAAGTESLPSSTAEILQEKTSCWEGVEEHLRRSSLDLLGSGGGGGGGGAGGGGVWRADSLDSLASDGSFLSLAERVEMNRNIVKQMLYQRRPISSDLQRKGGVAQWRDTGSIPLNESDLDSGISLQDNEHNKRLFVLDLPLGSGHEQTKRLVESVRMKARSFPLKADHSLLPLQTHTPSGVGPLRQAVLRGKEGVALLSGNLSDSSSGESACGPPWHRPALSPTRVRFEDETEKEAESRYLERQRQRRRAGGRAQGLLVSKPDLSAYVNGRKEAEPPGAVNGVLSEARCVPDRQQRGGGPAHCNSCGTVLEGGVSSLNLHPRPSPPPVFPVFPDGEVSVPYWVAPGKPRLTLRTERIKETYIGTLAPDDGTQSSEGGTDGGGGGGADGGAGRVPTMRVRRRTNRPLMGLNRHAGTLPLDAPQATAISSADGSAVLPLNPYAPRQEATPAQPRTVTPSIDQTLRHTSVLAPPTTRSSSSPPPPPDKPALRSRSRIRRAGRLLNQNQDDQGGGAAATPQEELRPGGELQESCPSLERELISSCSSGRNTGTLENREPAVESQGPPTQDSSGDGQVRGPMRAESRDDCPGPEQQRGSRLSLRRIFSAVRLGSRTGSLDRLSSRPGPASSGPASPGPASPGPASSGLRKLSTSSNLLRKTPSLQSLSTQESPFLRLRKSSSLQSFQSDQKKNDRSAAYSPVTCRGLQRALSVQDVGSPSSVRPVGRVVEVCCDGTLLLRLSRPPRGNYGFMISRGRGRPDSGVYVEDMVDSSTEKLYAGLLGVGDEIVEVNGEKVAGLSLDLVTRLLTENSSASVRVLRHRKPPPR